MIGIFNTIIINDTEVFRPNDFTLQRENIYAAEIETCTGKRLADLVGWRYSDLSLSFDTLPQDQLTALIALTGQVEIEFTDELGTSVSENVIIKTTSATATRLTGLDGSVCWQGIALEVSFIDAHN